MLYEVITNEKEKTVYGDADQIIKNVRTDVENSLRRLQTEYIDIYQLHDGGYDPGRALELQSVLEELVSARITSYNVCYTKLLRLKRKLVKKLQML